MKNIKGITIISLVIIIIVLIILAGVSVNLLLGENGIITKAKEAKRAQEIAEIKEKLSLEIAAAETDAIIRNENLEQRQLEDIVNKYGTLQEDKDTIITKKNNYEISLKEIWYGVLSESGSYTDKVKQIEILEKELAELRAKYEELEKINEGNTQILEELRNQIETLQQEVTSLKERVESEKEKTATTVKKFVSLMYKHKEQVQNTEWAQNNGLYSGASGENGKGSNISGRTDLIQLYNFSNMDDPSLLYSLSCSYDVVISNPNDVSQRIEGAITLYDAKGAVIDSVANVYSHTNGKDNESYSKTVTFVLPNYNIDTDSVYVAYSAKSVIVGGNKYHKLQYTLSSSVKTTYYTELE